MLAKIKIRRDTSNNWININPILAEGELALEKDTGLIKIGDGIHEYSNLSYINNPFGNIKVIDANKGDNATLETLDIFNDGTCTDLLTFRNTTLNKNTSHNPSNKGTIRFDNGYFGKALVSGEGNGYISWGDYTLASRRCISMWVKPKDLSSVHRLFSFHGGVYRCEILTDGRVKILSYDGSNHEVYSSKTVIPNQWYHFIIQKTSSGTDAGGTVYVHVNGEQWISGYVRIGNWGGGSDIGSGYGNFLIEQVRLFTRMLSQDEINRLTTEGSFIYQAYPNETLIVKNNGATTRILLPTNVSKGHFINIRKHTPNTTKCYCLIDGNGNKIHGGYESVLLDLDEFKGTFIYIDNEAGWIRLY